MDQDRLDRWQIHDLRTRQDIEEMEGPCGALRAFVEAKDAGLVRYLAVIGMKVLGGSHYISTEDGATAELLLRFALSREVSTIIVGCASPREVQALARVGTQFQPLAAEEEKKLLEMFRPHARRLAYYRGAI